MPRQAGPFDDCLLPLARHALKFPDIEGQVVWWEDGLWAAQDDDEALLDAEELAFYAEGLLAEGFGCGWQLLAEADHPKAPVLALLFFWQGAKPAIPAPEAGWVLFASGLHTV